MADIELVIKLPERDYDLACNYPDVLIATYAHYIKDGTPLPKGHGRLVDEKDLSLMTVHMIDGVFVCDASTIIEADKTGK